MPGRCDHHSPWCCFLLSCHAAFLVHQIPEVSKWSEFVIFQGKNDKYTIQTNKMWCNIFSKTLHYLSLFNISITIQSGQSFMVGNDDCE